MEFLKLSWFVIRRRWSVILLCLAVCLAGAALFTAAQPKTYTAQSMMFLRAPDMKTSASAYQGDLFTRQRAQTYMNLFSSDDLAKTVVDELHLPMTPAEVESKVSAENIKDTVIIVVSVTDTNAQQAANIANGYSSAFGHYVLVMENLADDPTVKPLVSVVKTASADTAVQNGYSTTMIFGAAVALALVLSAMIMYALERLDTRLRTRRQLEAMTGAPVIGTFGDEIADADISGNFDDGTHGDTSTADGDREGPSRDGDALADSARRLLTGIRTRLEVGSSDRPQEQQGLVTVFGADDNSDASHVATALALAAAAAGDAACVIRVGLSASRGRPGAHRADGDVVVPDAIGDHIDRNPEEVHIPLTDAHVAQSRERINELGKEMDLAVIDAPSARESAACDIAIQAAGSAVIVVSPGVTTKVALADAAQKVATLGRPLLGVVVTRARDTDTLNGVYL